MAGIYIHIPYCKKLCNYCDFYHITDPGDKSSFLTALLKEIEDMREYLAGNTISTIYIGGGTPSVMDVQQLGSIIKAIYKNYTIEDLPEITIELNPDDITLDYARSLRDTGVNRISMGVQSWYNDDLKMLGRRHNALQAEEAVIHCIDAGFSNITIDLIYGIPGMTADRWSSNLKKTFSLPVKHLSAYHLTIEPGTMFGKMKERGLFVEIEEEESTQQFNILIEEAGKAGFIQYEISNFGKPGFFSKHNTNYWRQVPYLGVGPSAHSFNGYTRQWNIKDVKKYIKMINNDTPCFEKEELDQKTRFNEYIMTSLRTMWGIDLEYVEKNFEKEGYDYVINTASKFIKYGMVHQEKNALVLTDQGKMISDNIISDFMMPPEE
jgi:oxygen-independent coproporphyrinogen III oxidase